MFKLYCSMCGELTAVVEDTKKGEAVKDILVCTDCAEAENSPELEEEDEVAEEEEEKEEK